MPFRILITCGLLFVAYPASAQVHYYDHGAPFSTSHVAPYHGSHHYDGHRGHMHPYGTDIAQGAPRLPINTAIFSVTRSKVTHHLDTKVTGEGTRLQSGILMSALGNRFARSRVDTATPTRRNNTNKMATSTIAADSPVHHKATILSTVRTRDTCTAQRIRVRLTPPSILVRLIVNR